MKFKPEPWANAFIKTSGSVPLAEEALELLRVFCRVALTIAGDLSGRTDADRLGRCIAAASAKYSPTQQVSGQENGVFDAAALASHFIQLMLQKHCFYQYKRIIREIEKAIYRQKGIEEVIVETAEEPENEVLESVRRKALRLTGANDIKLIVRVIPDMIGGIRLRWGSNVLDGSIKQRLENMARDIVALGAYGDTGAFLGQELEA